MTLTFVKSLALPSFVLGPSFAPVLGTAHCDFKVKHAIVYMHLANFKAYIGSNRRSYEDLLRRGEGGGGGGRRTSDDAVGPARIPFIISARLASASCTQWVSAMRSLRKKELSLDNLILRRRHRAAGAAC